MAVPWWLVAQGAKMGRDYLGGKAKQSKMKDLSKITPHERDYVKRQREIAESGDPLLQDKLGRQVGAIRQEGQFQRQRQFGTIARQGLENSIIADELRRRTDKGVMDQISEESGKIAEQNRLSKQQAQGKLDDFNFRRDERLRQIAMQTPTDSELLLQAGQSAVGMGMDYLGNAEWDATGGEKDANGNPTGAWKFPSLQTGQVAGSGYTGSGSSKKLKKYTNDWDDPANVSKFKKFSQEELQAYIATVPLLKREEFKQWLLNNGII